DLVPLGEQPPMDEIFDEAEALARVDADRVGLRNAAERFLARDPDVWASIRTAVADRQGPKVARLTHKLKGQVGIFSARALRAAGDLETAGREGDSAHLDRACTVLERELELLDNALQAWLEKSPEPFLPPTSTLR